MFQFLAIVLSLLYSAQALEGGKNKVAVADRLVQILIADEYDARELFRALERADEYVGDSALERELNVKSEDDYVSLECRANTQHYCTVLYGNRSGYYIKSTARPYRTVFELSPGASARLAKTLELPMRRAGATVFKEYKTQDSLFKLVCARHRSNGSREAEPARCWLEANLN